MANVTRIKASDPGKKPEKLEKPQKVTRVVASGKPVEAGKTEKVKAEATVKAAKASKVEKAVRQTSKQPKAKKPFILFRPFVAFFRYLRDAWREIRQVRWPNRKATWKMVLAVVIYTAMFMVLISLLDLLFRWLFSLVLGN